MSASYSEKLRSPLWQKKRLKILDRDGWKCRCCKDEITELHVHHLEYKGNPEDVPDDKLITLCKHCHFTIEDRKLDWGMGLKAKKITSNNWVAVAIGHTDGLDFAIIENDKVIRNVPISDEMFSSIMHIKIDQWHTNDTPEYFEDKEIADKYRANN